MSSRRAFFDVVDIDPFGSCNIFVESAIRAVRHNGLLAVTSTDTAVLCTNAEKCYAKYNTLIQRSASCHESAIRTVLSFISRAASRNGAGIEPLLCMSVDFYVRVFVRVIKNRGVARASAESNSFYLMCRCANFVEISPRGRPEICSRCELCGRTMKLCGPFWSGAIQNRAFVRGVAAKAAGKRLSGILGTIASELDTFGYFSMSEMTKFVGCEAVSPARLADAAANAGYLVSLTHCKLNALKTNASAAFLYAAILKSVQKKSDILNLGDFDISFRENEGSRARVRDPGFYRGYLVSQIGPLSRRRIWNCAGQDEEDPESTGMPGSASSRHAS